MAHYAKIVDGLVASVIVADESYFSTFKDTSPGKWLQCSYNTKGGVHLLGGTPLRKNYPGIGWSYNEDIDGFVPPKPYPSWNLNTDTGLWDAPVACPDDGTCYKWDEATTSWVSE